LSCRLLPVICDGGLFPAFVECPAGWPLQFRPSLAVLGRHVGGHVEWQLIDVPASRGGGSDRLRKLDKPQLSQGAPAAGLEPAPGTIWKKCGSRCCMRVGSRKPFRPRQIERQWPFRARGMAMGQLGLCSERFSFCASLLPRRSVIGSYHTAVLARKHFLTLPLELSCARFQVQCSEGNNGR
jgi:hypothetical protein